MKKHLFLLSSILTVGVLLTACGSPNTAEEDIGNAPEEAVEEVVDEEAEDSASAEEVNEETEGDANAGEDAEESDPPGTLTQSEEQNYELYILDGYVLTAEEPKKDALYAEDNSAVFMRIETFTAEEADFAFLEESMKQTLAAVNADEEPVEASSFDRSDFKQASAYEVPSTEGTVTGIVYEKENLLVRLTVFDDNTINATEDFITMGKTIELPGQ